MRPLYALTLAILFGLFFTKDLQAANFFHCPLYPIAPDVPPPKKVAPHVKPLQDTLPKISSVPNGVTDGSSAPLVGTIPWQPSYDVALQKAKQKDRPWVCFFCDTETAQVAGDGPAAWDKYRKEKGSAPSRTVFESRVVQQAIEDADLREFVKIAEVSANADRYKKFGVSANALVICAPDGDVLAVFPTQNLNQTNLVHFLNNSLDQYMAEWRKAVQLEKDQEAAALKAKAQAQAQAQAQEVIVRARPQEKPSTAAIRAGDVAVKTALTELADHLAKLDECAKAGWTVLKGKDGKDVHPLKEVVVVLKTLTDLGIADGITAQPAVFLASLYESQTRVTALFSILKSWAQDGAKADGLSDVNAEYKRFVVTCEKLKKK